MTQRGFGSILVVDDEELVCNLTREVLQQFGYSVLIARNGEEALAVYREKAGDISVVVLDLIMPGVKGKEVFHELRSLNPDVRVVISSGDGYDPDADHLLKHGAAGIVLKPYSIADLLAAVEKK